MDKSNWRDEFDRFTDAKTSYVNYAGRCNGKTIKMYEEQLKLCGYIKQLEISKVIFNKPATIIIWSDGVKTVVKAQKGDKFDPEKGLAMAIAKRVLGNKGSFNNEFKKWIK